MPVRCHCSLTLAVLACLLEVAMADSVGSKVTYFLVGLGIGALVGPKAGEETRDFLSKKADEGKEYAQRKARELRERADELIERGKEVERARRIRLPLPSKQGAKRICGSRSSRKDRIAGKQV